MVEINIPASKINPEITFLSDENILRITGRSVLKNMDDDFYTPVYEFIRSYVQDGGKGLILELYLDYFNTSSHPSIIQIFKEMGAIENAEIHWCYEQNDVEMMEIGSEMERYSPIPFKVKPVAAL